MTACRILITGSQGLIGSALAEAFSRKGVEVIGLDLRSPNKAWLGDVCNDSHLERAVARCSGIVHLAGVSRVIWGEQSPGRCRDTNIGGTAKVLATAARMPHRPWVLFSSSREVYGEAQSLPVDEDASLAPVNAYAASKIAAERLIIDARTHGLRTAVVRLSNVYGSITDHPDRVIPAFARAAARGEELCVQGDDHTFDFTHLEDAIRGLEALVALLSSESQSPPPIHLLTGIPTTLGALAQTAVRLAGTKSRIVSARPRPYDVSRFYGDPTRAHELLGWRATISVTEGLGRLIADFAHEPSERAEPGDTGFSANQSCGGSIEAGLP